MRARGWLSTTNLAAVALTLAACGGPAAGPTLSAPPATASALPESGPLTALLLIPASATAATLTDFDAMRVRFGVPEMTSADLMTDRNAFWERVDTDAVLLADGVFRADNSRWELDYGFTEDDVDWEVHWTGPEGSGYAVGFRPDLDLGGVRRALSTPQLAGTVLVGSVLVKGLSFGPSWADDPAWLHLVLPDVESAYLRHGCEPLVEALGDAAADDPKTTRVRQAAPDLEPLDHWSVSFGDGIVTALVGLGRHDVIARTDLGRAWPETGPISFNDGFTQPLDDPEAGRIGYRVVDPQAAAALTLGDELPFAVCNDAIPVVE